MRRSSASENETTEPRRRTLVIDFDGTITERNTLHLVVEKFGDPEAHRRAESELGRTLTLHEVIARGYGSVRAAPEAVVRWLVEHVRFRPGFAHLLEICREHGWRVVVVSSGVRELIEPLLQREGMRELELVCNTLSDERWSVRFLDEERCDVCGESCKRRTVSALADGSDLIYVGDGYSDGCAALAADRVFARHRLAAFLERNGVEFDRFEDFFDIAESLERDSASSRAVDRRAS